MKGERSMAFAFFKIACDDAGGGADALNAFVRNHRIVHVTREWVEEGGESFWAFCVEYRDAGVPATGERTFAKIDYREVLPPAQFEVYSRLRKIRQGLAEKEGIPVFAVFSNEHLAEMVKRSCQSMEQLKAIPGVGEARAEKYGRAMLDAIGGAPAAEENPVPP